MRGFETVRDQAADDPAEPDAEVHRQALLREGGVPARGGREARDAASTGSARSRPSRRPRRHQDEGLPRLPHERQQAEADRLQDEAAAERQPRADAVDQRARRRSRRRAAPPTRRRRQAGRAEPEAAHVVQVDDEEREDDPVPERVDHAADLEQPDVAREPRIEPSERLRPPPGGALVATCGQIGSKVTRRLDPKSAQVAARVASTRSFLYPIWSTRTHGPTEKRGDSTMAATQRQRLPGDRAREPVVERPALAGDRAGRTRRRTWSRSAAASRSSTRSPGSAPSGSGSSCTAPSRSAALGAVTGGQAVQMVRAGLQAIYLSGWQVAAEANLAGHTYPDQSLYPANSVPALVRRLNNALLRADQIDCRRGARRHALARADRRRRRGRLRRRAQRVRADEGDDRGGRRRRPLRGPARGREEVRPPGRQGARPDEPVRPHAARRAARRGRARRADRARRPHRRAQRLAAHERHRPGRRGVPHRRAHAGGLLPRARRHRRRDRARRSPTRRTPTCSGSRPRRPTSARPASSRTAIHERLPGQAARVQLLAVVQLEAPPRRRRDRELPRDARRARLPVPVHHARRLPLAERRDVRARRATSRPGHARVRRPAGARVRARGSRATRRRGTSARSAPATSTASPRSSAAASPRRSRSRGRPRPSSSSPKPPDGAGIEVHAAGDEEILSPGALDLVERPPPRAEPDRLELLARRHERAA